ncbi:Piso0_000511 [Millerozyma farinosa CBS 7064]|uniref:Piso0_000511 protein n=1 Tax=Pichia sorbitophila (strain ATCC MYA-4447 / BCRC 22081 / CBS 7064 / NBRC 10061 / NRRL Y-12695) TaxID=559304 RepID=G8YVM5_PICSO|nr:Piso0_000511 [Millerozyma farinosa CBS 7064]CCE73469.1 Piso0_000511 [Millerozyma farinosa CBS 7064]
MRHFQYTLRHSIRLSFAFKVYSNGMTEVSTRFKSFPQFIGIVEKLSCKEVDTDSLSQLLRENNIENHDHKFDLIIENQRGMKLFGIPLFSNRSLIPILDPSNYQMANGHNLQLIHNRINNYPLPDLGWEWSWDKWYVLMVNDVDDQGWIYSKMMFRNKLWKGKYNIGDFIRRRVWVRMRHKVERDIPEHISDRPC